MGTTTDGKAPNVTMSHAADTSKDGLKRAVDVANEESGDASERKSGENSEVKRMQLWVMMELLKAKTSHQDENITTEINVMTYINLCSNRGEM